MTKQYIAIKQIFTQKHFEFTRIILEPQPWPDNYFPYSMYLRPTFSLFLAVESHFAFSGFLKGTHSPPWSKVITDWIELSEWGRKKLYAKLCLYSLSRLALV